MKKLVMLIVVAIFGVTTMVAQEAKQSCCRPEKATKCEKETKDCEEFKQKWAKFETLSVEEQKTLLETRKTKFKEMHTKLSTEFKEKAKANELSDEMKERQKEAHKNFKSDWKKFESMNIAEQKNFFDRLDKFFAK